MIDAHVSLGMELEIKTNGKTVWINGKDGKCLWRFQGLKEVHVTDLRESEVSRVGKNLEKMMEHEADRYLSVNVEGEVGLDGKEAFYVDGVGRFIDSIAHRIRIMVKTQEELLEQQEGVNEIAKDRADRIHELEILLMEARTMLSDLYSAAINGETPEVLLNRILIYLNIPVTYGSIKGDL